MRLLFCLMTFLLICNVNAEDLNLSVNENQNATTDFIMTRFFANNGRSIKAYGIASISASSGICWQVTKPITRRWLITKDGITEFDQNNVTKFVAINSDSLLTFMSTTMASLVSSDLSSLDANFSVTQDYDKGIIYLRPKQSPLADMIFSISLSYKNGFITEIKIVEHNNSYTQLDFINQKIVTANSELKENYCRVAD
jgi:hypothetical protein